MFLSLKKFHIIKTFIFLSLPIPLASVPNKNLEKSIEDLQEQINAITAKTAMGETGIVTAKAVPDVKGHKWFLIFEILRWHPKVGGTAFAYSNEIPSANLPIKGTTKHVGFNWHWGIKFGVGHQLKEGWEILLQYQYIGGSDNHVTTGTPNSPRIALKGVVSFPDFVSQAKDRFSVHVHSLDLDLGRNYFVSKDLAVKPHFGLKSAWVDLREKVRYTGGFLNVNSAYVNDASNFWGMGLKFGFSSQWFIKDAFYISSSISGAFLYGLFDVDHNERHSIDPIQKIQIRDNQHRFAPFAQGGLGIGWGSYFASRTMHIAIDFGYEVQYFFRQNQMLNFYDFGTIRYDNWSEDLSFHGFNLKARWDF